MKYYVIWPNGQRFGPADMATLRQWVQENRIDANTVLEEERSLHKTTAGNLLGLGLGVQSNPAGSIHQPSNPTAFPNDPADHDPFAGQPYMGYYRPAQQQFPGAPGAVINDGKTELIVSWVLGGLGLVTICCTFGILPLVGLGLGFSAKSKGQPSAMAAIIFNGVVLAMTLAMVVFQGLAFSL